jgi:hypothetical protein
MATKKKVVALDWLKEEAKDTNDRPILTQWVKKDGSKKKSRKAKK